MLARDVEMLKSQLETFQENTVLLSNLVASLQGRVAEVEDAMMEESNAEGEVVSMLSSDLDPVENMVAIPVPAPSIVCTLVPVEFVPSSLHSSPSPPYV